MVLNYRYSPVSYGKEGVSMKERSDDKAILVLSAFIYTPIALMLGLTLVTVGGAV